ncbi:MAG: hypothetical protein M0Z46_10580 [Actinomycetota bacterium]|jgi:hypothetical protein|nr:hypothetical protein [Actinomycetota bacterium]
MTEGDTSTDTTHEGEGDGLVETIRSVVSETLGELFGTGKADVEDKAEGGAKAAGDPEARTWTPREIQEAAAAEMRRVQDELRAKAKAKPKPAPAKAESKAEGGDGGAGTAPATTAPSNPKSWRNRLWGDA